MRRMPDILSVCLQDQLRYCKPEVRKHKGKQVNQNAAKKGGTLIGKLFAFLALALLICNTAAGLASRLAGSLALAAAAA